MKKIVGSIIVAIVMGFFCLGIKDDWTVLLMIVGLLLLWFPFAFFGKKYPYPSGLLLCSGILLMSIAILTPLRRPDFEHVKISIIFAGFYFAAAVIGTAIVIKDARKRKAGNVNKG